MNAERRKKLSELQLALTSILDAEQEAFDNLPENLQDGEKAQVMEETLGHLQDAVDALESID
jgi:hypothetical protein